MPPRLSLDVFWTSPWESTQSVMSNSGRGLPSSVVVCSTRRSDFFARPISGTSSGPLAVRVMSQTLFRSLRNIFRSRVLAGFDRRARQALLDGIRAADLRTPGEGHLLGLAGPLDRQEHLAVLGRAEDVQLLAAGQDAGVEAFHRAVAGLDGGLAHPGGHRRVEPLEAERQVDLDPNPVAAPVLEWLDRAMDGADLGAGDVDGAPRLFGPGRGGACDGQGE